MTTVPCPCCEGSAKLDLTTAEGLRRLRVVLGLTGKDAAARLNVHPTTVSNCSEWPEYVSKFDALKVAVEAAKVKHGE